MDKRKILLILHTVKYLCWSQIWFRVYYRFLKLKVQTLPATETRNWRKNWISPAKKTVKSILSLTRVVFIDQFGDVVSQKDWNCPEKSKIWLYNLHYLDELTSIHAPSQVSLLNEFIEKWIDENPPYLGNGWEPYPLSLRLVNLVKWYATQKNDITTKALASISLQAAALAKQPEYHIRANHLFVNGKALIFAGAFLNGPQADSWLQKGLGILDAETKEQFLEDGAHFELSPMYHASLLWDLCDLVNLAERTELQPLMERKNEWRKLIDKGLHWLELMCHPDGEIAFFNDAAFGIAPSLGEIQDYAKELGQSKSPKLPQRFSYHWLKESGYCVVNIDETAKAILDIGKIGPDYQPGHAHADTLSFELSLYGQRFIVNSGTSQYGENNIRQLQRSTKSHNTVCINNENSSEVWAGFRVARRAYPLNLSIRDDNKHISIDATHNGYLRLPGRNLHHRQWQFSKHNLKILDTITGPYDTAEVRFHFHPDIQVKKQYANIYQCSLLSGEEILIKLHFAKDVVTEASTWHPFFGASIGNCCLVATFTGSKLLTEIEWGG